MWNLRVFVLVSSIFACSAVKVKINSVWDLVEGDKAVLPCIADSGKAGEAPVISFIKRLRASDVVLKSSADKRIVITQKSNGSVTTGTLTFNKVEVSDATDDGYYCQATVGSTPASSTFQLYVLPKKSEQVVTFANKTGGVKSEPWSVSCVASAEKIPKAKSIDLKVSWHFSRVPGLSGPALSTEKGMDIKITEKKTGNKTTVISKLTIEKVEDKNGGYYTCSVSQKLPNLYHHVINKTTVLNIAMNREMDAEDKVKVKKGNDAELVCKVGGFPSGRVEWTRDGDIVDGKKDKRVSFGDHNSVQNAVLKISDTEFSDRGVYMCNATNSGGSVTVKFILRIKDPLGPLWPFIGILVEIVILAIIIFVSEKYRVAAKRKAAAKDPSGKKTLETSPLLAKSDEPGISYSAGGEGGPGGITVSNFGYPEV